MKLSVDIRRCLTYLLILLAGLFGTVACSPAQANHRDLPKGAESAIENALSTIYTWRPVFDLSIADALQRARDDFDPQVWPQLIDLEDEAPADWDQWKREHATITPKMDIEPVPGTQDGYTEYVRWVTVTQRVTRPDGSLIKDYTFTLKPVTVRFEYGRWVVSAIGNLDQAGGGICPRNPDGSCRPTARHQPG